MASSSINDLANVNDSKTTHPAAPAAKRRREDDCKTGRCESATKRRRQAARNRQETVDQLSNSIRISMLDSLSRTDSQYAPSASERPAVTETPREAYQRIIESNGVTDAVRLLKLAFFDMAQGEPREGAQPLPQETLSIPVHVVGEDRSIDVQLTEDRSMISIGRFSDMDVVVPSPYVSRFHCALCRTPDPNFIALVDFASLNGSVVEYVDEKDQKKTGVLPEKTGGVQMIPLPLQPIRITLCDTQLLLAPKTCITCLDRPRAFVFSLCKHFVCCKKCVVQLSPLLCPICRGVASADDLERIEKLRAELSIADDFQHRTIVSGLRP